MTEKTCGAQHPVPDAILTQIGDVTVSFAMLEFTIQMLTGALIAERQTIGQIITAELSFKSLRALLASLYIERYGEDADYETLKSLNKRAANLEDKRNLITHSIWGAGDTDESVTRMKTTAKEKRGMRLQSQSMDVLALQRIAKDMKLLSGEYVQFHVHLLRNGKAINNPYDMSG